MLNESKWDVAYCHCPFLGHTGYANHAREFFTALNDQIPVRIRNFTHTPNIDYLTQKQKDMVEHQTWNDVPWEIGTPFKRDPKDKLINIILMETNHFYFYDNYIGPKIAYNVWESTRQPIQFFNKLKEYDQIWVPTNWQRECTIEQGIPAEKVFVVPEGVDLNRFYPIEQTKNKSKFQFMIFGRWDYRKYTREMVKAFIEEFDKNEPVELLLSADNPYPVDTYNSTEERLEKYELKDDRIKILHFPSSDDYTKYLQTADCMLMVSRSEGWGLPGIEALACGTPTLITDWGAPLEYGKYAYKVKISGLKKPEHVFMQGDTPGLWAEPDFKDLKKQMRFIYENYDECKQHTLDGLDYIRTFNWKNAADIAMKIINNIDNSKWYPKSVTMDSTNATKLPYDSVSVDEVKSFMILNRLTKDEVINAFDESYRILKIGGKLIVEVPDFESIMKKWVESENKSEFIGEEHKFGFTIKLLNEMLFNSGFFDFTITNINQERLQIIANKKELKYDDDIFVIDTYPSTEEKMGFLKDSIERTKKAGKPIAIVTHYPLPEDILKSVDYVIFDKHNPLSENYSLTYWAVMPKEVKIVTSLTNSYHGLCCLTSMKNAATFLKDKYKFIHFLEYDTEVDLDKYLKTSNYHRVRGKKFIGFDYHWKIPKQDGIITNIFTIDANWFDEKMILLRKWKDYDAESWKMSRRIGKESDLILEHWMWNYFCDRDMLKDSQILAKTEKDELVIRGNMKDQMDEEPDMHFRLSETDDHKLIMFILRDDRVKNSAWYKMTQGDTVYEGTVDYGKLAYHMFEKSGIIEVESEFFKKQFIIDPEHIYQETIFRFYDDRMKCMAWDHNHDKDFIYFENSTPAGDTVKYSFIEGAKTEIVGDSDATYEVEFINGKNGMTVYTQKDFKANHWCAPSPRYYVDWNIIVRENGKEVSKHTFNCEGKNILIQLDSRALGDTIAWIPYLDEFRKEHKCKVFGRTFHNNLFRKEYPEINWIEPGKDPMTDIYAYYNVGCRDNDYLSNKNNWRSVPLQQVCSDYIGIDYKEIRPKVTKPNGERPIKDKYVAMSEHSTFQCKYWLYRGGWQTVIEYLKSKGYKVIVISKEKTNLKGIINKTNRPMDETINTIQHADLFMGVSSGPSWLAWALDTPVVLVSGYSAKWGEFQDNCARIVPPEHLCHGCFNDRDATLDRGNWNWCPRSKNFECSTGITPEMVISGINKFI